jgi:transcriptional regulator with XRE-family HTH domain
MQTQIDEIAGKVLRRGRKEKKLSAVGLSQLCGITDQKILRYENARTRILLADFVEISTHLSIELDEFLGSVKEQIMSARTEMIRQKELSDSQLYIPFENNIR